MAKSSEKTYMDVQGARSLCTEILVKAGIPGEDAAVVIDNLIRADLRGIGSHGISRLQAYCHRIDTKFINPTPNVKVVKETSGTLLVDGDNGLGAVIGTRAMDMCIQKAKQSGIAACSVFKGNHFGIAGYYAMKALPHDMIGMAFCNAPPTMNPWGSVMRMLGTNPFCFAIPAEKHRPLVLDCATSLVARGKVILAALEGKPIPKEWALDAFGNPTEDPEEAKKGSVLPLGGYKGSGLSMVIDILSSLLSGAQYGTHVGELYNNDETIMDVGFLFIALDIKAFQEPEVFKSRLDEMIDEIKNSPKRADVDEIYIPGEIEFNNEDLNMKRGIEVGPGVLKDLSNMIERYHIDANPYDYISSGA